jgi:trimethylamine--corrinoid protein Co-methyltransferase
MGQLQGCLRILSQAEMAHIHGGALRILADVGMWIDCEEALTALAGVGCAADLPAKRVWFPERVVQGCVERMRAQYAARSEPKEMPYRYAKVAFTAQPLGIRSNFTVSAGGFPPFIYDLEGVHRRATLEDVRDALRLADGLAEVDLTGLPCSAQEVPHQLRPVVMTAELVKHTAKLGGIEAWTVDDVEAIWEMAVVVRGCEEELRRRPVLVGYSEVRSPLCLDRNMAETFIAYIRKGLPQTLDTMPVAGTTAPATIAGTLALGFAESLAGLVLAYSIDPEACVRVDVTPALADMKTGLVPVAGPDRLVLLLGAAQMIAEHYGCLGGVHGGKTDACLPGEQAGMEKALSLLLPVLAGAPAVGTVGQLENLVTFSPLQLVIDAEFARVVRRIVQGFEATAESLALDVLAEVGPGGTFIDHPHTASVFRRDFFLSGLLERSNWEGFARQELRGLEERAREKARHILKEHHPDPLSAEQKREIDRIVTRFRERHRG